MDATRSSQSIRGQDEQKLYNELKSAIWVVRVDLENTTTTGTGFCINTNGLIMTCAHCVPGRTCLVARQNDKKFQKAAVLHKVDSWDIAILCLEKGGHQPNVSNAYPLVSLAKDGTLIPGQDVYAISHQHRLMYYFSSGKISYPCKDTVRPFGKLSSRSSEKETAKNVPSTTSEYRTLKEVAAALDFHEDLPMIEIRNIHLGPGASGGPIFLPTGEVLGLFSCGDLSKSYAVHVSALRIAFKEAEEKYSLLVAKLAAKNDEQLREKSADISESDKSDKN